MGDTLTFLQPPPAGAGSLRRLPGKEFTIDQRLCPKCGGQAGVVDCRPTSYGTRRRRKCHGCSYRWTTIEISQETFAKALAIEANIDQLLDLVLAMKTVD
jgi:hypothetical protein